ncbi:MAG: hypothetical protein ABJA81_11685 [Nocardioidaceae bacterium]
MNTFRKSLLVTVLVAACFGCAAENSAKSPSPRESGSSTTESTSAPDDQMHAVSVSFRKSGGLKPVAERTVFAADVSPPAGYTASDVDKVLTAASDPRLEDLDMTPMPSDTCCDRQTYEVTITWADRSTRTFTTIDGIQQPKLFEDLLSML